VDDQDFVDDAAGELAERAGDQLSVTHYDPDHSIDEDRDMTIGTSAEGRLIFLYMTGKEDLRKWLLMRVAEDTGCIAKR
jgi:hypothetical protein